MIQTRSLFATLLRLAVLAGLLACSQHTDPTEPGGNQVVEIQLTNFAFSEPALHISVGTTVRWRNTTSTFHTVTPDGHAAWSEWQTAGVGETFEVTFNTVGSYAYYCVPHRSLGMTGTIIVE